MTKRARSKNWDPAELERDLNDLLSRYEERGYSRWQIVQVLHSKLTVELGEWQRHALDRGNNDQYN
jgi:hypothetical protein